MPLRVTFELSNKDLRHFRRIMRENRKKASTLSDAQVIDAAAALLIQVREASVSAFVLERMDKLEVMINMLTDEEWQIPKREHNRVVSALTYFADPDDLIHELLKAPVQLIWNGGIGTYVKASSETHDMVGNHIRKQSAHIA